MTHMHFDVFPADSLGVAVQSAKHSGQRLRFTCSHFREIIYVEALLPRPHMPGQICLRGGARLPFAGLPEGNQSQRSVDREC